MRGDGIPPPLHERLGASRNRPMGLAKAIQGPKCEKLIFSSKNLEIFRTCPNASRCIRMHPNASEHVRAGPSKSENLKKLAKTSKKSRKLRENFRERLFHIKIYGWEVSTEVSAQSLRRFLRSLCAESAEVSAQSLGRFLRSLGGGFCAVCAWTLCPCV